MPDHASLTSTNWSGLPRRLAVVGYLGAVALCSGLAFVALCREELGCLAVAVCAGILALGFRAILRSGLESEVGGEDEFCSVAVAKDTGLALRAEELAELVRACGELEKARGTRRFDPWTWKSLRAEIQGRLRDDAELRRLLGLGG